ncbi:50S ribosomal protein L11 methyltransferase [Phragmitibacter flavus]|uniref:50S ribosomal protein L11 methyltransferase n=2 Tax=Phragmitibacter flavus TaxID=2576071 RepID=A0A5R8K7J3_9BACT|nr:50S ribosomal protein L11 methyltransferase [Phragmitibacter flavus]
MFVWSKLSSLKWMDVWEEMFAGEQRAVMTRLPGKKTIRLEVYCEKKSEAQKIFKEFGGSVRELKAQNWAAMGSELPEPVKIGKALLLVGTDKAAELVEIKQSNPGREVISIPPELAFGTGHHATTATALRMLVDFAKSRAGTEWSMIDLGTGSGVLAIAAEKLGAGSAWGCDFDAMALRAAAKNLKRNKTKKVVLEEMDVFKWKPGKKVDCVMANIFHDILEKVFPKIAKAVRKDGMVVVSGILKSQAAGCLAAGEEAGLVFEEVVTKGKWVTARGRLK